MVQKFLHSTEVLSNMVVFVNLFSLIQVVSCCNCMAYAAWWCTITFHRYCEYLKLRYHISLFIIEVHGVHNFSEAHVQRATYGWWWRRVWDLYLKSCCIDLPGRRSTKRLVCLQRFPSKQWRCTKVDKILLRTRPLSVLFAVGCAAACFPMHVVVPLYGRFSPMTSVVR